MTTTSSRILAILFIVSLARTWSCPPVHGDDATVPLLRLDERFDVGKLAGNDAQVAREGDALVISTGRKVTWPGVTIPAPDG
ncbi:MAG: hypothetical protein U1E05_18790, partial [Patescibacteria group bacterium]|nr:hypothetical protein [Patescibacteria group bacterium]